MAVHPRKPDCYEYIRNYYHVPAYVGVRVTTRGRTGVIVPARSMLHYVHILFDDAKHSVVCHPTNELEYELVGVTSFSKDELVVSERLDAKT